MPSPEFTTEEIGHDPIASNHDQSLTTDEKRDEQIAIGKAIAILKDTNGDGVDEEEIIIMPPAMKQAFYMERQISTLARPKK